MGMGMANAMGGGVNMQGLRHGLRRRCASQGGAAPAAGGTGSALRARRRHRLRRQHWTCSCGAQNTGRFCGNCGSPKPQPADGPWTCSGTQNTGRFCGNCGSPRP